MQNQTWKPPTAGILSIIAGVLGVVGGIIAIVMGGVLAVVPVTPEIFGEFLWIFGVALITLGIVAIIGGICALIRRRFSLALAGCICSLICVFPVLPAMILGLLAIIFVGIGKREFE